MKDEKKLKKLADIIWKLETECQLKNNVSKNMNKIERLIQENNLSLEDMLKIDTYIQEKNILTK